MPGACSELAGRHGRDRAAAAPQPLEDWRVMPARFTAVTGSATLSGRAVNIRLSRVARDGVVGRLIAQDPLTIVAIGPLTNLATLLEHTRESEKDVEARRHHGWRVTSRAKTSHRRPEFKYLGDPEAGSACWPPVGPLP